MIVLCAPLTVLSSTLLSLRNSRYLFSISTKFAQVRYKCSWSVVNWPVTGPVITWHAQRMVSYLGQFTDRWPCTRSFILSPPAASVYQFGMVQNVLSAETEGSISDTWCVAFVYQWLGQWNQEVKIISCGQFSAARCSMPCGVGGAVSLTTGPSSAFWDQAAEPTLLILVCIITMLLPA